MMWPREGISRRELLAAGGAAPAASSVAPSASWAAPAAPAILRVDPLSLVDPELRAPLELYRKEAGDHPINAGNLARVRKLEVNPPLPAPHYQERSIPGAKGSPNVQVF